MNRRELIALMATLPYVRRLIKTPESEELASHDYPGFNLGPGVISFKGADGTWVEINRVDEFHVLYDYGPEKWIAPTEWSHDPVCTVRTIFRMRYEESE